MRHRFLVRDFINKVPESIRESKFDRGGESSRAFELDVAGRKFGD